jgi:NTE family protein
MTRQTAFVFGGGGARGALQVGAVRALLEAGLKPDLLVGTSIGAVNAVFLALRGFTPASVQDMAAVWRQAAAANLLPGNYLWLTLRALMGRPAASLTNRIRSFVAAHGLGPELRFRDLRHARLILVATDLHSGRAVLYGQDPDDPLLEGLLASLAVPPWMAPFEKDGRLLMDGSTVSFLPIEPALAAGATDVIALDLSDERGVPVSSRGLRSYLIKLLFTVEQRQQDLELALAAARGVPVTLIRLRGKHPILVSDFKHTEALFDLGYESARLALSNHHGHVSSGD